VTVRQLTAEQKAKKAEIAYRNHLARSSIFDTLEFITKGEKLQAAWYRAQNNLPKK
jgi:hypothetical protein